VAQPTVRRILAQLDQLNEFERAPVTADRLQGGGYYAAVFAGEHIAATEFVIGALFVKLGAGAFDVLVGLLIGNLLAVLSWAFLCAPIAVRTRLTLYWYLRRIGGPGVMVPYNVLNGLLHCVLAGCMITVSASAIRIPFGIAAETRWYPQHASFVVLVLVIGAAVVTLAILGFKRLAQFAGLCAPWMVVMFIAGALAALPALGLPRSSAEWWQLAEEHIWKGSADASGLGFWHIVAFAWVCNLATHVGLTDMALFRYARHWGYGFYSAFGMYVGHYLSWICAGVMGAAAAVALGQPLAELDSGAIAYQALGASGALAVVIAGWTTANPTLYRAGLALQAVTPGWPRWLVTLATGAITTAIACFPFVFTRLLDFVGVYGLMLMPVGAIVVVEHWVFPRIGLTQYWATRGGRLVNLPALAAWGIGLAAAAACLAAGWLHLFFLAGPVWLLTAVTYIALAALGGARERFAPLDGNAAAAASPSPPSEPQVSAPTSVSPVAELLYWGTGLAALFALALCVVVPLFAMAASYAGGETYAATHDTLIWFVNAATVVYFLAAVVWERQRHKRRPTQ
jgi:NCS1 family nucleobase:cation symporter-1